MAEEMKIEDLKKIAGATAEFYIELVRKGVKPDEAANLAKRVGSAASSNSDGRCGSLVRPRGRGN